MKEAYETEKRPTNTRATPSLVSKMKEHTAADPEEPGAEEEKGESETGGGSGGRGGDGASDGHESSEVTASELEAVARVLVRRCLASGFRDPSCADVSFLLDRAASAAAGCSSGEGGREEGRDRGSRRRAVAAGCGGCVAASRGEAAALLDGSLDQAITLALEALAANRYCTGRYGLVRVRYGWVRVLYG